MEAKNRIGRFIKRRDPVLRKVHVVDFNFEEICSTPLVSFDNADSTIVHARYHPDDELKSTVRRPDRFDEVLTDPTGRRPVLRPLDFTRDWEKEKSRRKHRSSRNSDDDDYDLDSEIYGQETKEEKPAAESAPTIAQDESESAVEAAAPVVEGSDASPDPMTEVEGMAIVGKAIKSLHRHEGDGADGVNKDVDDHEEAAASTLLANDFIPAQTSSEQAEGGVFDPEESAAETYKQRKSVSAEELEAIRAEAHEAGYLEGFKLGEEKGEIQVRQNATQMFARLNELLLGFRELKQQILSSTQDNFYELAQAVAETLIGHELRLNPQSFADFMRKVIRESVAEDDFKIKVHPKTLQRLEKLDAPDLQKHFVADDHMADGDFMIDSKLSVVDVNVRKMISDLLDQADLSLFESSEKAS